MWFFPISPHCSFSFSWSDWQYIQKLFFLVFRQFITKKMFFHLANFCQSKIILFALCTVDLTRRHTFTCRAANIILFSTGASRSRSLKVVVLLNYVGQIRFLSCILFGPSWETWRERSSKGKENKRRKR